MRYVDAIFLRIVNFTGRSEVDAEQRGKLGAVYDAVMDELRLLYRKEKSDVNNLRQIKGFLPDKLLKGHQNPHDFMNILLYDYLHADLEELFMYEENNYDYCSECEHVSYC